MNVLAQDVEQVDVALANLSQLMFLARFTELRHAALNELEKRIPKE
ncbi:hypothetical protein [Lederbergia lenta]|nr:hypothetical protein [Lederbergia lenta]MCM3110653.1 hypothetical protein [Lederbergia lenta]